MTAPAVRDSPYESIVGELERVELAARERRLTAEMEAEHIRAAAVSAVAEVESAVPGRVAEALAGLRAGYQERATAEVASVERRPALDDGLAASEPEGQAIDAAVDLVVAAVLGEPVE